MKLKTTLLRSNKRRLSRSGLTLIEVIASLTILSALMVMILLSFAQHQRQFGLVEVRQQANLAMDHLLSTWFDSDESLPANQSGRCSGNSDLSWQCSVVGSVSIADQLEANVLRVEIFGRESGSQPLSSIEIVDRAKRPEEQ